MKLILTFGIFYCFLVSTIMSAMVLVVMNCSSSFSAEKEGNSEIAAQQILAPVAVRIYMYVPIDENNVRVACCSACLWTFKQNLSQDDCYSQILTFKNGW